MDDRKATGYEKLRCVGEQCLQAREGEQLVLACPYCNGVTRHGDTFCCLLLLRAVDALVEAQSQLTLAATMDEIIGRHQELLARHANN